MWHNEEARIDETRIALLVVAAAGSIARADFPVEYHQETRVQAEIQTEELEGLRLAMDGNTFVNGLYTSPTSVAQVFVRHGTYWLLQTTLHSADPESGEEYGFAERVAVDGDTIAVGVPLVFSPL